MKRRPESPVRNSVYIWFRYHKNDPDVRHLWALYEPLIGDHNVLVLTRKKNIMREVERIKDKRDNLKDRMAAAGLNDLVKDIQKSQPKPKEYKAIPAKAPKSFKHTGVHKTQPIPQDIVKSSLVKIRKFKNKRQIEIIKKEIEVFRQYLTTTKDKRIIGEVKDNIRQLLNRLDELEGALQSRQSKKKYRPG